MQYTIQQSYSSAVPSAAEYKYQQNTSTRPKPEAEPQKMAALHC